MILATRQPQRLAGLGLVLPNYYTPLRRVLSGSLGAVSNGGVLAVALVAAVIGHLAGRRVVRFGRRTWRKIRRR